MIPYRRGARLIYEQVVRVGMDPHGSERVQQEHAYGYRFLSVYVRVCVSYGHDYAINAHDYAHDGRDYANCDRGYALYI